MALKRQASDAAEWGERGGRSGVLGHDGRAGLGLLRSVDGREPATGVSRRRSGPTGGPQEAPHTQAPPPPFSSAECRPRAPAVGRGDPDGVAAGQFLCRRTVRTQSASGIDFEACL